MLVSCLAYSSTLTMEPTCSSETSIDFYRTIQRYITEERNLQTIQNLQWTLIQLIKKFREFWNPTLPYHVPKCSPLDRILSQFNPTYVFKSCFLKLISFIYRSEYEFVTSEGFPLEFCMHFQSPHSWYMSGQSWLYVKRTNYRAPRCVNFSIFPVFSLSLSYVQLQLFIYRSLDLLSLSYIRLGLQTGFFL
jgi:hypothetical protein